MSTGSLRRGRYDFQNDNCIRGSIASLDGPPLQPIQFDVDRVVLVATLYTATLQIDFHGRLTLDSAPRIHPIFPGAVMKRCLQTARVVALRRLEVRERGNDLDVHLHSLRLRITRRGGDAGLPLARADGQ